MLARLVSGLVTKFQGEQSRTCLTRLIGIRHQTLSSGVPEHEVPSNACKILKLLHTIRESRLSRTQLEKNSVTIASELFALKTDTSAPVTGSIQARKVSVKVQVFSQIFHIIFEYFQYICGKQPKDSILDFILFSTNRMGKALNESDRRLIRLTMATERGCFDQVETQLGQLLTSQFGVSPVLWDLLLLLLASDLQGSLRSLVQFLPLIGAPVAIRALMPIQADFRQVLDGLLSFELNLEDDLGSRESFCGSLADVWSANNITRLNDLQGSHPCVQKVLNHVITSKELSSMFTSLFIDQHPASTKKDLDLQACRTAFQQLSAKLSDQAFGNALTFAEFCCFSLSGKAFSDDSEAQLSNLISRFVSMWGGGSLGSHETSKVCEALVRKLFEGPACSAYAKQVATGSGEGAFFESRSTVQFAFVGQNRTIKVNTSTPRVNAKKDLRHFQVTSDLNQLQRALARGDFGNNDLLDAELLEVIWRIVSCQPLTIDLALKCGQRLGLGSYGYIFASCFTDEISNRTLLLEPSELLTRRQSLITRASFVNYLEALSIEDSSHPCHVALMPMMRFREAYLTTSVAKLSNAWHVDIRNGKKNDYGTYIRCLRTMMDISRLLAGHLGVEHNSHFRLLSTVYMLSQMSQGAMFFARCLGTDQKVVHSALVNLFPAADTVVFEKILEAIRASTSDHSVRELCGLVKLVPLLAPGLAKSQLWTSFAAFLEKHTNSKIQTSLVYHISKSVVNFPLSSQLWRDFCASIIDILGHDISPAIDRQLELLPKLASQKCIPKDAGGEDWNNPEQLAKITTSFKMVQRVLRREEPYSGLQFLQQVLCLPDKTRSLVSMVLLLIRNNRKDVDDGLQEGTNLSEHSLLYERVVTEFANNCNIDATIVQGLDGVAKCDYKSLSKLATRMGVGMAPRQIRTFVHIISQLRTLEPRGMKISHNTDQSSALSSTDDLDPPTDHALAIEKASGDPSSSKETTTFNGMEAGDAMYTALFREFDINNNGTLDFIEFCELLKYLDLNLSQYKMMQLFTQNAGSAQVLDEDAFKKCIGSLEGAIAEIILNDMGIRTRTLVIKAVRGIGMLLLLLMFIFLSIAAFTQNDTIGMIVNSVMPIIAVISINSDAGIVDTKMLRSQADYSVSALTIKMAIEKLKDQY